MKITYTTTHTIDMDIDNIVNKIIDAIADEVYYELDALTWGEEKQAELDAIINQCIIEVAHKLSKIEREKENENISVL